MGCAASQPAPQEPSAASSGEEGTEAHVQRLRAAVDAGDAKALKSALRRCGLARAAAALCARDADGCTLVTWCAIAGEAGCLRLLLEDEADPNAADNGGETALHWAASCGHEDCVAVLAEAATNLEARDQRGSTPLMDATRLSKEGCLCALLRAGASTDTRDKDGKQALHWAANAAAGIPGAEACLRALLRAEADPCATCDSKWTPLHVAGVAGRSGGRQAQQLA